MWASQLAQMLEGIKDEKYWMRKKVYDTYLLILMALREFNV